MTANYCLACVASVSNRVMARKLEREQKKTFFALVPTFLDELARKRLLRRLTTVLHVLDFPLPSFCLLLFT